MCKNAVTVKMKISKRPCDKSHERTVAYNCSLRLSGGTGGVDHISTMTGCCKVYRPASLNPVIRIVPDGSGNSFLCQDHFCPGILKHI